jgi:hypothetical protein
LTPGARRQQIALVGIGDAGSAAQVLVAAAQAQQERGKRVLMVDLTSSGALDRVRLPPGLVTYRPQARTTPSSGALRLAASATSEVPVGDPRHEDWTHADVVLVLGEIELGVGTEHLAAWAEQAVLLVRAGQVTAEFLRSTARTMAMTGPEAVFAMLAHADVTDQSVGLPPSHARDEPRERAGG